MIAANGSMVITTTNRSNGLNQVTLFQNGFTSQTTIASTSNYSYLDTAPGISDDGNVVVFQGTLTPTGSTNLGIPAGPGIFAAVNTGTTWQTIRVTGLMVESPNSTGNHDGICDPGELCIPAAELGFDDSNKAINFASYPTNSRVAVANLGLGAAGIADDSFVISFVGTPSHASRTNPVTKNFPLLFSNQTGLWTIRVDAEHQLSAPNALVFHPYTAIPVAQVGDQIGPGNFIASIAVNQQIANAAKDELGNIRTMRRGDHRVAFQATTTSGAQIIYRANHLNSDQDGILDHWKTTGIDMDQDGVIDLNLAAMGATIGQRDLFLEMDWLSDQPQFNFHPAPGVITSATGGPGALPAMLATAPALSGNMYGVRSDGATPAPIPAGITMHIDGGAGTDHDGQPFSYNMGGGSLNGGDQIGMVGNNAALVEVLYLGVPGSINVAGVNTRSFQDAKDHFFGSLDKDARELAFKYAILADHYTFDDSPPANHPISGGGANFILVGDAYPPGLTSGGYAKITAGTGAGQIRQVSGFNCPSTCTNQMFVTPNFTTIPDNSSTFAYISGSSGVSEVYFNPAPDHNTLPGNDFMLTLGDWGVNPDGYLMNSCTQWRTLAHEMGHTLGLRHGGIDQQTHNANYLSLMSYSHQLVCNVVSQVQSYSTVGDPVFDDFANLNHQFAEVFFNVGNSIGTGYGSAAQLQAPEQNVADYIKQNGPIDFVKPMIAITAPAANSQVGLGGPLTVSIQATDNVSVARVQASFDANGDGTVQPTEILTAQPAGTNIYTAKFNTISGGPGTRTLTAIASDTSGNTAKTSISLNVANSNSFVLSVTKAGTGSGTVTSNPVGISCGTTCSANYAPGTVVALTAAAASGSTFTGWSGACTGTGACSVTMSAAKSVTATFTTSTSSFALSVTKAGTGSGTVTSNPVGINCGTTCSANYAPGTVVALTAAVASGSTFTGWSGACTGTGACSVTMSAAKSVTATFTKPTFVLSVTKAGTGSGTVTSNPVGINCGTTCSANYAPGTVVALTAAVASGSTFTGWSGACTGTGACSVTMSAAKSVTATFTKPTFVLSVTKAGTGSGTVTSNPVGINCGTTCSANYAPGTVVALTAAVASGSTFTGWSGACTGTGACSVTMSAAKSVTATFTKPTFVLSVTKAGTGSGTVTSNPVGINCGTTCSANYAPGTVVALTAAVASGSTFTGWSGACTGTGACSVTMSAAKSVTATFTKTHVRTECDQSRHGQRYSD